MRVGRRALRVSVRRRESSRHLDTVATIAFGGKPAVLRHGWIANAAGYNFHNWYGFGAVAVDAALEMMRNYTLGSLGDLTRMEFDRAGTVAIPDNDALTSDPGGFRGWSLLSNAFYGENPNGD